MSDQVRAIVTEIEALEDRIKLLRLELVAAMRRRTIRELEANIERYDNEEPR